jgi:hypothetical protein
VTTYRAIDPVAPHVDTRLGCSITTRAHRYLDLFNEQQGISLSDDAVSIYLIISVLDSDDCIPQNPFQNSVHGRAIGKFGIMDGGHRAHQLPDVFQILGSR